MAKIKTYLNYIAGRWVDAKSGATFPNINPAHPNEVIGLFPDSGPEDVERAVEAAAESFNEWRLTPPPPTRRDYFKSRASP